MTRLGSWGRTFACPPPQQRRPLQLWRRERDGASDTAPLPALTGRPLSRDAIGHASAYGRRVRVRIRIGDVGIIRGRQARLGCRPGVGLGPGLSSGDVLWRIHTPGRGRGTRRCRGLDAIRAERQRDCAGVAAGFQEPHSGVSQYGRGAPLFPPMLGH